MPFVHFVYHDIQLKKEKKLVNKKKNPLQMKVYKSRLPQLWKTLCMGPNKGPKNL